jgi:sugar phosphate isomerase/epimerase
MNIKALITACLMAGLSTGPLSVHAENKIPEDCKTGGFFVGCQAWTFNHFTLFEAIEMTAQAGGKVIEFSSGQILSKDDPNLKFDHNSSPEVIQRVKEQLALHHIVAVNYGVVGISKNEAQARKVFDFAKTMGLPAITTESVDAIDMIEKLVKEYDIKVGFHDHPRKADDPKYRNWDPNYILSVVSDRDPRIGACADTGHWVRSGLRPVDCLRILKGRIISCHMKDLNKMGPGAHDVPDGTGVSDVPGILEELKAQNFDGNISIEYEYNTEHSLPEVSQCIGFIRGYGEAKHW